MHSLLHSPSQGRQGWGRVKSGGLGRPDIIPGWGGVWAGLSSRETGLIAQFSGAWS